MQIKLSLVLFLCTITGYTQTITLLEGNTVTLKGQNSINTEFTYDNMRVGKNDNEQDFIEKKRSEFNARESGRGDRWANDWIEDRSNLYEPKFRQLLEKNTKLIVIDSSATYTMIVHTTYSNVGFSTGFWIIPTFFVDLEIIIVETKNRDNIIAKIMMMTCPGRNPSGVFYETGPGLQEAYAKAGKELGKFLKAK